MQWKKPKNTEKYHWTQHVQEKMHYYGLSEQKVLGVIRSPKRIETGIVENTVAVMIPVGNIRKDKKPSSFNRIFNEDGVQENWSQEIWVLYQIREHEAGNSDQEKLKKQIEKLKSEKTKKLMKLMPKKLVIISAWRYPGASPKNNPIPEEILREIEEIGLK